MPFVVKEQAIAVARGQPAKIVSKKQQVQFIQSNFFTNKRKVILFYSPVLRLRSLQRRETTSSIVERRRKQVSKRARNNFLNPELSFQLRTRNVPTEFTLFFNADKVT